LHSTLHLQALGRSYLNIALNAGGRKETANSTDSWSAACRFPALEAYTDALGGLNEGIFYQSSMLLICDRLGQWR